MKKIEMGEYQTKILERTQNPNLLACLLVFLALLVLRAEAALSLSSHSIELVELITLIQSKEAGMVASELALLEETSISTSASNRFRGTE